MLGRRGLLVGALGVAALSACDTDGLRPPEDDPTAAPSPTSSATVEPDADQTLVNAVVTALIGAETVVARARQLPRLKRALAPLARAHAAHLEVLEADNEGVAPAPPAPYADSLGEVRTTEEGLQRMLANAAVEAQSGALARLLASMSASVSQHLFVLPGGPDPDGPPR